MRLRFDFRKDHNGLHKPVIVDDDTGLILPGQIHCSVDGAVGGEGSCMTATVTFILDGEHVRIGIVSTGGMTDSVMIDSVSVSDA